MQTALALAPLILAAVLILSGIAKLRDVTSTHSLLRLLRLPAPLTQRWVAQALPYGELALAALLLGGVALLWEVIGALLLVLLRDVRHLQDTVENSENNRKVVGSVRCE